MILDLFAGPGGWDEGLKMLGRTDVVGIEHDLAACQTAMAAGHARILADVEALPLSSAKVEGLIASPPCQDFSLAGKQEGRTGERGRLIDVVPDLVDRFEPEWIACEQVPPALPIWQEHAHRYRELGYSVWCGILNAANFGVPQTRKRAILIASRVRSVTAPAPTHAKTPVAGLFDTIGPRAWGIGRTIQPWVTMAQALGWGFDGEPSCTVSAGGTDTGGAEPFGNANYRRRLTAFVSAGVTGQGRPKDPAKDPADTLTGKGTAYWMGDVRAGSEGGVRVTVAEGGVLQSFRPDYPWQGSRSKQYQQVGNAIPPLLAAHVLGALVTACPVAD